MTTRSEADGRSVSVAPSAVILQGAFVDTNVIIEADVHIGVNAVVLGPEDEHGRRTTIRCGASIGANATVLPGLVVGASAVVSPGSVVTKDVPANITVAGSPACIISGHTADRTVSSRWKAGRQVELGTEVGDQLDVGVGGCRLHRLPHFSDVRGDLYPIEFADDLPFSPRRIFLAQSIGVKGLRGEHAHRVCRQFLIAAQGSLAVVIDDGRDRSEITLNDPSIGLDLKAMVWAFQHSFSPDTALLVFASHSYEPEDYVRNYQEFKSLIATYT